MNELHIYQTPQSNDQASIDNTEPLWLKCLLKVPAQQASQGRLKLVLSTM